METEILNIDSVNLSELSTIPTAVETQLSLIDDLIDVEETSLDDFSHICTEIEDVEESPDVDVPAMMYPCIIMSGVETKAELELFSKERADSSSSLPLYVEFKGSSVRIGDIQLDLDRLLMLKFIGEYDIKLAKNASEINKLDLNDPTILLKFIRL